MRYVPTDCVLAPCKPTVPCAAAAQIYKVHSEGWLGQVPIAQVRSLVAVIMRCCVSLIACNTTPQMQLLRKLPLAIADYLFDGKGLAFFVYGDDEKVFAPDYPKIGCNCTML